MTTVRANTRPSKPATTVRAQPSRVAEPRRVVSRTHLPSSFSATQVTQFVGALAFTVLASCGGNLNAQETAVQSVVASVDEAEERARPNIFDAAVRWSPVSCEVPEWQVLLWDQWQRADVRGVPESLQNGEAEIMRLRTLRGVTRDDNGWAYAVLEVVPTTEP